MGVRGQQQVGRWLCRAPFLCAMSLGALRTASVWGLGGHGLLPPTDDKKPGPARSHPMSEVTQPCEGAGCVRVPRGCDKSCLWLKQHVYSLMVLESEPKSGSLLDDCWSRPAPGWFHLEARGAPGVILGLLQGLEEPRSSAGGLTQPDLCSCRQLSALTSALTGPCNDTRAPGPHLPRSLAVWSRSSARAWMSLGGHSGTGCLGLDLAACLPGDCLMGKLSLPGGLRPAV